MLRFGEAPYLECSSRGDKRFSAWYAKVNGLSIEEIYQAAKLFDNGAQGVSPRQAKDLQRAGYTIVNYEDALLIYSALWDWYIREHPHLLKVLREASGLSDIFGQEGHACQAKELWRIRNDYESFPRSLYENQ